MKKKGKKKKKKTKKRQQKEIFKTNREFKKKHKRERGKK